MDSDEREGAELDVVIESVGSFSLIGLSGEVDVYSAPILRETIKDLVDDEKYNIVVDLEKVAFLEIESARRRDVGFSGDK